MRERKLVPMGYADLMRQRNMLLARCKEIKILASTADASEGSVRKYTANEVLEYIWERADNIIAECEKGE